MKKIFFFLSLTPFLFSCQGDQEPPKISDNTIYMTTNNLQEAIFAGGCFWCIEGPFDATPGVSEAISGYIEGSKETANYQDVSSGTTKHREAVRVSYNPDEISYGELLKIFFRQIDPVDTGGQFADRGFQYTTAVYYKNDIEKKIIEQFIENLEESGKFEGEVATKILPVTDFYEAEEYHQDYAQKSSFRYNLYKK